MYAPGWAGEEWMKTGDLAGGFRQLVHFPQFRLGVSRSDWLALGSVVVKVGVPVVVHHPNVHLACRAPAGWRVALAAELVAAGVQRGGRWQPR